MVARVECNPTESQYRSPKHFPTVKDLDPSTVYKFGIVVNMADGQILPIKTAGHRMVETTAAAPTVDLKVEAWGFAETHIHWDWQQPDPKRDKAIGESVTIYRTRNYEPPDTELGHSIHAGNALLAHDGNSKLESAVIELEPGKTAYGPFPMFPLWKPAAVMFTFAIQMKLRLPEGSRETHRILPIQAIQQQTPPEPEFDYIFAKPLSFSDVGIEWGWNTTETSMRGDKVAKFVVFRSEGRVPGGFAEEPTIIVDEIAAIDADTTDFWKRQGAPIVADGKEIDAGPVVMHYRSCVASGLGPVESLPEEWGEDELEYTFGIVVHMANGLKLDMRTVVQKTALEPTVDYFIGETLSCSAVSLAWGWAEHRQMPIVPWIQGAERFAICRSEDGVERDQAYNLVQLPAPNLELASRGVTPPEDDYPDYVVTGLGPQGLCSLSDGMKYNFSVVVKMRNGVELPQVKCTAWTAPRTFLDWTAEEVALWVRLDVGYPQYSDTFFENDVSGAVAAVLTGEDMEIDLQILKWSPRMAILLAIQVMVENSKSFGHYAIGYASRNVERAQKRTGAVWDAIRSVDGGPLWWRFATEVVWGADIPTEVAAKDWHDELLPEGGLTEPALWKLPPSTFKLRSGHPNLQANTLMLRPTFFHRDEPGGPVNWHLVDPPPRAVVHDEQIEGVDAIDWVPRRRRRGLDTIGPVQAAAIEAGIYEAPVEEATSPTDEHARAGAIMPDSRRADRRRRVEQSLTATVRSDPAAAAEFAAAAARGSGQTPQRSLSPPSEPPSESPKTGRRLTPEVEDEEDDLPAPAPAPDSSLRSPGRVAPHRSRPFKDWDANEVSTWVQLVLCMPEHAQAFLENDVNGELATILEAEELQEDLGIASAADRLKILTQIGKAALQPVGRRPLSHAGGHTAADQDQQPKLQREEDAGRWLGGPAGRAWASDMDVPEQLLRGMQANAMEHDLQIGSGRPQTGPIVQALRGATLRGTEGEAALRAAGKDILAAGVAGTGDSVAADPRWWKFVGDVTRPAGSPLNQQPEDDPNILPWEQPISSDVAADLDLGLAKWLSPAEQSGSRRASFQPAKKKEWERLLDSASIRDLRLDTAETDLGSPVASGGLRSIGARGPQVGRMSAVAKSLRPLDGGSPLLSTTSRN